MITREEVMDALRPIVDPEIHLSIVDLGLIYDAVITPPGEDSAESEAALEVKMTLTTPMCPYGPMLVQQVTDVVDNLPGVDEAKVTLVWDPPWDPRTMASDEVKDKMGIW